MANSASRSSPIWLLIRYVLNQSHTQTSTSLFFFLSFSLFLISLGHRETNDIGRSVLSLYQYLPRILFSTWASQSPNDRERPLPRISSDTHPFTHSNDSPCIPCADWRPPHHEWMNVSLVPLIPSPNWRFCSNPVWVMSWSHEQKSFKMSRSSF